MESCQLSEDFTECIKLGILHSPSGRFLTAEVFNNEINVSGTTLRRRQVWTLISERGRPDTVYIQSHLGRFLSADKDGKVSAASKIPGVDERFLLEYSPQATGEWAFRSEAHGYYLSGSDAQISCFSKTPVWWAVRLAVHPQINLRNQFRSRYLRLLPDGSELRADQPHPWGQETLIWLEQVSMTAGPNSVPSGAPAVGRTAVARFGRVALRSESGHYLQPNGSLTKEMNDSTLYAFELRPGHPRAFAFRDSTGSYLTTVGPGTLKVKPNATTPGKEELFLIERAALQVGILAHNNKYASVKQGVEISANQHELDDTAIFQLEYIGGKGFNSNEAVVSVNTVPQSPSGDSAPQTTVNLSTTNGMAPGVYCLVTGYWRLRARCGKLWLMAPSAGVQSAGKDGDKCSLFEILTVSDDAGRGHVVLKANTPNAGQSLSARKLGAISTSGKAVSDTNPPADTELFRVILVNRPTIALVSLLTGGFVSRGKQTFLDCSSATYDRFHVHLTKNNTYQLFAKDSQSYALWWANPSGQIQLKSTKRKPEDDPLDPESLEPGTEFLFHFLGYGRALIRVVGQPSDGFTLVKAEPKGEVKWDSTGEILANYIWEI